MAILQIIICKILYIALQIMSIMLQGEAKNTKPNRFSVIVKQLNDSGFSMKEIASELGMDNSVLTKLCNGTLKSSKGEKLSDLITKLTNDARFGAIIKGKKIDVSKFDMLFSFYYWSAENQLRPALLGIVNDRISECRFYYLQKDLTNFYAEKDALEVKSLVYENSETMDIVLSKKKTGATFISAHLGNKEINEIEASFCSYCGAMGSTQKPYAGIGLLEKVEKENFSTWLEEISLKGIPPQITNALYKRRFDLSAIESKVYDSIEAINITQKEPLKLVNGQWLGYYLRSHIEGPNRSGGIVKVLMDVEESGVANIYFRQSDNPNIKDVTIYSGFFKFPNDNSAAITIGEFQSEKNVNRLVMYLKPDAQKLKGVFTGYRTIDLGCFTSAIFFEKLYLIRDENQTKREFIENLINEHRPARYHKSKFIDDPNDIRNQLKSIQEKTFETVENCFNANP